jgi:hypothetical protein
MRLSKITVLFHNLAGDAHNNSPAPRSLFRGGDIKGVASVAQVEMQCKSYRWTYFWDFSLATSGGNLN